MVKKNTLTASAKRRKIVERHLISLIWQPQIEEKLRESEILFSNSNLDRNPTWPSVRNTIQQLQ